MTYQHLLSAGKIGDLEIPNRIMLAPMGSMYAEEDGSCGERLWEYYEARAKGGTGLLILETSAISWPNGSSIPRMLGFGEERFDAGLRTLVERVHKHGSKVAAQLNHSGKMSAYDIAVGRPVPVPSVPGRKQGDLFAALTQEEMAMFISSAGPDGKGPRYEVMEQEDIDNVVRDFAKAAKQCKDTGFDAVEIHGGHGYLISSFLSPNVNKREDKYGGSVENRTRLLTEIITAVRAEVGENFPILVRIDAHEYRVDDGIRIEHAVETARLIEAAGADAIDVSAYGNGLSGIAFTEAPLVHKPGGLLPFAHAVKKAVSIPVIGVGRISPELAESEIDAGNIDFVALGRPLLADDELPNKLAAGKASEIRPCIFCYVCVSKIFVNSPIVCAVNPGTGRESTLHNFTSAESAKNVAIVGGGPAGMEAARVLAIRGHNVTLFDKQKDLGGTARIAALPYAPNGDLVQWLIDSVERLPIDVRLGTTVDADALAEAGFDHILVATGALRSAPNFPGKELDHVFDGDRLRGVLFGEGGDSNRGLNVLQRFMVAMGRLLGITRRINLLRSMSKIYMPLGKRVVLIGGGLVGLELAEFLVERGRKVTVVEPSPNLGAELAVIRRARVLHMLREDGVELIANAEINQITGDDVVVTVDGEERRIAADHVVISMGAKTDTALADKLQAAGVAVTAIGDCQDVGYIEGAILSARSAAVAL